MDKLNILVLHKLGNPNLAVSSLRHHVMSLATYQPGHNYLFHDIDLDLPQFVKDTAFDAIILDVTLMCCRWWSPDSFRALLNKYAFVAHSNAVKLAFPQDDYDGHLILDDWMCEWDVDRVFSVIPRHWDLLYPSYSKRGSIRLGYTGYIDESLLRRVAKPFDERRIDIGYRAKKLFPNCGRIGETKWRIGLDVLAAARRHGLNVDIVIGEQGKLLGERWLEFIEDSKFTLGANSGSSLLDPRGEIRSAITAYLHQHPGADFDEIERHCFIGRDGHHAYTAISPRIIEAAMLGSCQILVDGEYSDLISPNRHYIPLRDDASNFDEVLEAMRDRDASIAMARNCREQLLSVNELRYATRTQGLIAQIQDLASRKRTRSSVDTVSAIIDRYQQEMGPRYRRMHLWQQQRRRIIRTIDYFPPVSRLVRWLHSIGSSQ